VTRFLPTLLLAGGALLSGPGHALQITSLTPQGEVARVRQIVAKFDQPAVNFGDPKAPAPLSVSCTVVTKDDKTGEDLPVYLARLRLLEVKKGDAKKGDEILVTWRAIPKDVLGPWTVYYYPGEVVLTHLTKKSGGASYGSTWWNAKGDDIKAPESTELPETPGETFDAPKDPADQHPL